MKIGLVVPGFSASERDWSIPVLLHLVRRLSREHEVHVFPLRYPHHRTTYRVYDAVVHPQGGATATGMPRLQLLRSGLAAVLTEHRQSRFDVVHGVWADEPAFIAAVAGRVLGVANVATISGGELVGLDDIGYGGRLSHVNQSLTWIALRAADRVTVGSASLRRLAEPHVPANRLLSIPLGVETELFSPRHVPASTPVLRTGEPRLLHVASLVPVKDQTTLVQAMAILANHMPSAHLHVVGDGPLRGELQRLVQALGITPNVTFHGALAHDRMPVYYRAADLCVLSSRYESQGLVALEAAACGRGTVGTAVGVLPELSPGTRTVPVRDVSELAEALIDVASTPGAAAEMGRAARVLVTDGYTLTHTVGALLATYEILMER